MRDKVIDEASWNEYNVAETFEAVELWCCELLAKRIGMWGRGSNPSAPRFCETCLEWQIFRQADLGNIHALKFLYRPFLIKKTVKTLVKGQGRRIGNNALLSGMRELEEEHNPHIRYMTRWVYESQVSLTGRTICKSWVKPKVLSDIRICDLNAKLRRIANM